MLARKGYPSGLSYQVVREALREHGVDGVPDEAEFDGLTDGILSPARSRVLRETCWHAWELADAGDIGRAGAAG